MTAREIAGLWLISIAGISLVVYDHRSQMQTILGALGSPVGARPSNTEITPQADRRPLSTNSAMPMAGNEFGPLATYGTPLGGDVQPSGPDLIFSDIFYSMGEG